MVAKYLGIDKEFLFAAYALEPKLPDFIKNDVKADDKKMKI